MREFDYASPADVDSALARQAAEPGPGMRYLGGGTTLFDLMKLGVERPVGLVDVTRCAGLATIDAGRTEWRLGATATMNDVAGHPEVQRAFPALAESLAQAASAQIRNMATLGGNLLQRTRCGYFRGTPAYPCNKREPGSGCPAREGQNRGHAVLGGSAHCVATYPGDFAVALVAFDAVVDTRSPRGARTLPVAQLHLLPGDTPQRETVLADDELIVAIRIPRLPAARASVYHKGPRPRVLRLRAGLRRRWPAGRRRARDRRAHRPGRRGHPALARAGRRGVPARSLADPHVGPAGGRARLRRGPAARTQRLQGGPGHGNRGRRADAGKGKALT